MSISTFCYFIPLLYNIHSITLVTSYFTDFLIHQSQSRKQYLYLWWLFTALTDRWASVRSDILFVWSWTVQWCDAAVRSNIILLFDFFDYFYFEPLKYIFLVELKHFHCSNIMMQDIFIDNICVWWYLYCFILSFSLRHGCLPPFLPSPSTSPLLLSHFSPPPHSLKPFFLSIFSLPSSPLPHILVSPPPSSVFCFHASRDKGAGQQFLLLKWCHLSGIAQRSVWDKCLLLVCDGRNVCVCKCSLYL